MKKLIALLLLLSFAFIFFACTPPAQTPPAGDGTEIVPGAFDYMSSDLSAFITLPEGIFPSLSISVTDIPEITDADVEKEFNSYFSQGGYYAPKTGDDTVDEGDLLFFSYHGVLLSKLNAAVSAGKIPDVDCTGMSYSDILALSLGFSGGTTNGVTSITVGSANFIAGFEDGLVGKTVSAQGESDPVRLHLSFPAEYGSAELAGQEVIFFCRLSYIGDKTKGLLTKDTVTLPLLNELLGLSGERAYPSIDACLANIRDGLVRSRENSLYNQKANAVYTAIADAADFPKLPDEALTLSVRQFLDRQLAEFEYLYESSPQYYQYLFGNEAPSDALVASYYGYSRDGYMAEMKEDAIPAVKAELVYYFLLRKYAVSLSESEIAAAKEKYIALYGESIFSDLTDAEIRAQFLRDKVTEGLIAYLEENGRIVYTSAA